MGTARRTLGSMVYWRKKQGFLRKNQGSDGKLVKQETPQKMRCRDKDNIENKSVSSIKIAKTF